MARIGLEDRRMSELHQVSSYSSQHWSEAEARDVLAALEASGLSVRAFGRREGIGVPRLYFWRQRIKATGADAAARSAFVELRRSVTERVEVVLRSGRVLRVAESIDGVSLRRLVTALDPDVPC